MPGTCNTLATRTATILGPLSKENDGCPFWRPRLLRLFTSSNDQGRLRSKDVKGVVPSPSAGRRIGSSSRVQEEGNRSASRFPTTRSDRPSRSKSAEATARAPAPVGNPRRRVEADRAGSAAHIDQNSPDANYATSGVMARNTPDSSWRFVIDNPGGTD